MSPLKSYVDYCKDRKKKKLLRILPIEPNDSIIDFTSNDFLKLSKHPQVIQAAYDFALKYGVGSTGSRLLSGNRVCFEDLEQLIAKDKDMPSALVFNSGFQANATVLSALLDRKVLQNQPLVFFDKCNHASLYHAAFFSDAELIRYHHLDMDDLQKKLIQFERDPRHKFIVSETLFSMDGDIADLKTLLAFSKKYDAFLYLDEAFATGFLGQNGYGLSTLYDLKGINSLIMGTFSKAIGASGAYVACQQEVKNYLINACTGFIYSTAPSPLIIGAVKKAWQLLPSYNLFRKELIKKAEVLKEMLLRVGLNIGSSKSYIIPIIFESEEKTIEAQNKLLEEKILVSAIRPPSVPPNTSRLRLILNIHHSEEDIEKLLKIIKKL